jgi:hypothetical protein
VRRIRDVSLAALATLVVAAAPAPDWPAWFAKNTTVTDKKTYVHLFWNANDVRARFEGKDREALVVEAARQLVTREFPAKSTADLVKVDVVFVAERDGYGMPKWDTLRRVAHLEGSRKRILAVPPAAAPSQVRQAFDRIELF